MELVDCCATVAVLARKIHHAMLYGEKLSPGTLFEFKQAAMPINAMIDETLATVVADGMKKHGEPSDAV